MRDKLCTVILPSADKKLNTLSYNRRIERNMLIASSSAAATRGNGTHKPTPVKTDRFAVSLGAENTMAHSGV